MGRRAATEIGTEPAPVGYLVTMEDMVLFEPEGERNIHTDELERAARELALL